MSFLPEHPQKHANSFFKQPEFNAFPVKMLACALDGLETCSSVVFADKAFGN